MSAVMQMLYQTVVVKRKLSLKVTFSIHQLIYVPTLIFSRCLWLMTERIIWHTQATKMRFLYRVAGSTLKAQTHKTHIKELVVTKANCVSPHVSFVSDKK